MWLTLAGILISVHLLVMDFIHVVSIDAWLKSLCLNEDLSSFDPPLESTMTKAQVEAIMASACGPGLMIDDKLRSAELPLPLIQPRPRWLLDHVAT